MATLVELDFFLDTGSPVNLWPTTIPVPSTTSTTLTPPIRLRQIDWIHFLTLTHRVTIAIQPSPTAPSTIHVFYVASDVTVPTFGSYAPPDLVISWYESSLLIFNCIRLFLLVLTRQLNGASSPLGRKLSQFLTRFFTCFLPQLRLLLCCKSPRINDIATLISAITIIFNPLRSDVIQPSSHLQPSCNTSTGASYVIISSYTSNCLDDALLNTASTLNSFLRLSSFLKVISLSLSSSF